ncbi:MAG: hypothetical protein RLO80_11810 [Hyphomonas sp.]
MHPLRPLPDFWYPIARILLVLKALLTATAPPAFPSIAAHIYAELRLSGALVRRYLFALAHEFQLPPAHPCPAPAPARQSTEAPSSARSHASGFRICEPISLSRGGARAPVPDTYVEWALALQRVEALLAALRRPDPIARRIALRLARRRPPRLRELPVPAFVIRRIAPVFDILLMQLDALAQPDAWAGIGLDSS